MTMPAGKYYVGDLCYVMHERWDEFCNLTISGTECLTGEFTMKDGTRFAVYSTKWGDGEYLDQDGRKYLVDAGLIGCVRVADIDMMDYAGEQSNFLEGGQVLDFFNEFETSSKDGVIIFGAVAIDTDPKEDFFEGDDDNALDEEF